MAGIAGDGEFGVRHIQGEPSGYAQARSFRARRAFHIVVRCAVPRMRGMKSVAATSVDEYRAAQPEALRLKLAKVRATIRTAVPEVMTFTQVASIVTSVPFTVSTGAFLR